MNANELRIGNMVYKSLKSGQGRTVINPIGCQDIVRIFEDIGSFNYAPIPITEDILLKCGFEKHSNSNEFWNLYTLKNGWYISQALHIEDSAGVNFGCFYWSGEFIEIKHLHQLQNLFFCLCGKELTIKL